MNKHEHEHGQDILRALVDGKKCLNPDSFQRDCGECVICCFRSRGGIAKLTEGRPIRAFVPGTIEHAEFAIEMREALENAPTRRGYSRSLKRSVMTHESSTSRF